MSFLAGHLATSEEKMSVDVGQASHSHLSWDVCKPALTLPSFPGFHHFSLMEKLVSKFQATYNCARLRRKWEVEGGDPGGVPAALLSNGTPFGRLRSC